MIKLIFIITNHTKWYRFSSTFFLIINFPILSFIFGGPQMYTCAKFACVIFFSTWESKYSLCARMFLKSLIIIYSSFLTLIIVLKLILEDPLSSFSWYNVRTGNYCGFYSARYIMNSLCSIMSFLTNGSRLYNVSDNYGD